MQEHVYLPLLVESGHGSTVHFHPSYILAANDGPVFGDATLDAVRSCESEGPVPPGGKRNPLLLMITLGSGC